ncbi:hypothetical protein SASPL_108091 [Salvia splendens]|uniref:Uncharacterized protein n=1 Tax=Salvia splendens TaxID=180675 RepID=A0A8X9A5W8_SALSN|nr:hypothetical protein SASPL_108091 [Salvia splendens]
MDSKLSSLAELWKPSEPADPEDMYGIDYDMTLPQVLNKWQALEGMSLIDGDATSSSYPGIRYSRGLLHLGFN